MRETWPYQRFVAAGDAERWALLVFRMKSNAHAIMRKHHLITVFIASVALLASQPGSRALQVAGDQLFPIRVMGKYGFIHRTGKIVIPPRFESAGPFSEGLAMISADFRSGFIDKTGKIVIKPQFGWAGDFSDGLAYIRVGEDSIGAKYGFIDRTGRVVIPAQFDGVYNFSEGLACVSKGPYWGFIDKTGRFTIGPKFLHAKSFSEGLAPILVDEKWGYIGKAGTVIISPQFHKAEGFSEGLAAVRNADKWGFIDKQGESVIASKFSLAYSFSEGVAPVIIGGHYEPTGKVFHPFEFKGGEWAYVDKTGNVVLKLPAETDYVEGFKNGLAYIRLKDYSDGYIDRTGKYVWKPSK